MCPERSFSPQDPEFAFIGMAQMFTGEDYPNNPRGLSAAKAVLVAQHERIMPPAPTRAKLQQLIAQKDPVIEVTEQMAALALGTDDYETALTAANFLHAFGDIDYKDSLGGEVFELSLRTHRALTERIRDRFAARDPFLRVTGGQIFAEIEQLRRQGNSPRELELLRGIIHTVAVNGTLGEGAKQKFDPFAVVHIE